MQDEARTTLDYIAGFNGREKVFENYSFEAEAVNQADKKKQINTQLV